MSKNKESELEVAELSEDMEMIGPGVMLRDARIKLKMSQEDIALRLNFKISLVKDIEEDNLDKSLPATYNRGYLSSYAKVVGVDKEDVLASYDALGAAHIQRSEMQSFSKATAKQAEHSRLMWISYFIVAVLIGLTVMWWVQESRDKPKALPTAAEPSEITKVSEESDTLTIAPKLSPEGETEKQQLSSQTALEEKSTDTAVTVQEAVPESSNQSTDLQQQSSNEQATTLESVAIETNALTDESTAVETSSIAVFTFAGDCWVNIFDATGERIAWGVKKAGYVMTVTGVAPLKVTLGKPELASIEFNGEPVDMSAFNVGNIAKFTLPLSP
ncbi:RodZ domain-containing protein [Litorilituus lipolyticus]|uniref:DUF4115 domain-containing protein n=1 Tax=Litorilituus lipolyticus TaxID=2491017 RepID=A0A502L651_9GAMM|nr:RodZ domain-containing protein [Litorilituus lipolyticus]TPH18624.1 DUF4115 domain-containing protein [Litorilituus lipolyticus]